MSWRSVLTPSSICWRRYTIEIATESPDVELPKEIEPILDDFEDVVDSANGTLDFLMATGELLFVNNHRTLHARTPIASGANSDRLMIRSWIQVT